MGGWDLPLVAENHYRFVTGAARRTLMLRLGAEKGTRLLHVILGLRLS